MQSSEAINQRLIELTEQAGEFDDLIGSVKTAGQAVQRTLVQRSSERYNSYHQAMLVTALQKLMDAECDLSRGKNAVEDLLRMTKLRNPSGSTSSPQPLVVGG